MVLSQKRVVGPFMAGNGFCTKVWSSTILGSGSWSRPGRSNRLQMDWCSSDADVFTVYCGDERAEYESEALELLHLPSNPHLWPWTVVSDQRNGITDISRAMISFSGCLGFLLEIGWGAWSSQRDLVSPAKLAENTVPSLQKTWRAGWLEGDLGFST